MFFPCYADILGKTKRKNIEAYIFFRYTSVFYSVYSVRKYPIDGLFSSKSQKLYFFRMSNLSSISECFQQMYKKNRLNSKHF